MKKSCAQCGQPFSRGPKAKFCSTTCGTKFFNLRHAQQKHQRSMDRRAARGPCAECGKPIPIERRADARFCSNVCYRKQANDRWLRRAAGYMRRYLYGITPEEFDALFAAQGSQCPICKATDSGGKGWHLDHAHDTGKVRGILCHSCNLMLGHAKDDPARLRAALEYLSG